MRAKSKFLQTLFMGFLILISAELISAAESSPAIFPTKNIELVKTHLQKNIATKENVFNFKSKEYECNSVPGAMVAAPNDTNNPLLGNGYEYTWARDTAISMHSIASLYEEAIISKNNEQIQKYGEYLYNYINWLKKTVFMKPADISMFYVDGTQAPRTFQADGPPARVRTLVYISDLFINLPQSIIVDGKKVELNKNFVTENIFSPQKPDTDLIGYELNFICNNWNKETVGLWEMTSGHHYYTKMLDFNALIKGAALAKQLGYSKWSNRCLKQAFEISNNLKGYYQDWEYYGFKHDLKTPQCTIKIVTELRDPEEKTIIPTEHWYEQYKRAAGLNTAVLLGVLYGNTFNDFQSDSPTFKVLNKNKYYKKLIENLAAYNFLPTSNEIIQTAYYLRNANTAKDVEPPYSQGIDVYKINSIGKGPFIGRYPSDHYTGEYWSNNNLYGGPWFITTLGLARYYYTLANEYKTTGIINIPAENSPTPEVLNFFRQITFNTNLQPGTYKQGGKDFNSIIEGLINSGNKIVEAINSVAENNNMHMSEQIDRNTGKETSFQNLSWSYSSYIDTYNQYIKTVK